MKVEYDLFLLKLCSPLFSSKMFLNKVQNKLHKKLEYFRANYITGYTGSKYSNPNSTMTWISDEMKNVKTEMKIIFLSEIK